MRPEGLALVCALALAGCSQSATTVDEVWAEAEQKCVDSWGPAYDLGVPGDEIAQGLYGCRVGAGFAAVKKEFGAAAAEEARKAHFPDGEPPPPALQQP